jgi:hypothetical protein
LAYSNSKKDHDELLVEKFTRLKANKLYVNEEKSIFWASKINFLGYSMEKGLVRTEIEKIELLQTWPTPKNLKDVQKFLGFTNYYCRFV